MKKRLRVRAQSPSIMTASLLERLVFEVFRNS